MTHPQAHLIAAALLVGLIVACGQGLQTPAIVPADRPPADSVDDTLKVHMKSGDLYVLTAWSVDTAARSMAGTGRRYDLLRLAADTSAAQIHLDSVALFETNKPGTAWAFGLQGLAVLTTVGAYVSAV